MIRLSARSGGPTPASAEVIVMTTAGIRSVSDVLATMREQELRGQEANEQELPYVAAEILMGGAPNARADVFTIGVLAYQMVTGKLPFKAASLPELMGQMLQAKPAPPAYHRRRSSRAGQRGDPARDRRDARQPFRVRRAVCALVAMNRSLLIPFSIAVVLHVALAILVEPRVEIDSALYRAQAEALVAQRRIARCRRSAGNEIHTGLSAVPGRVSCRRARLHRRHGGAASDLDRARSRRDVADRAGLRVAAGRRRGRPHHRARSAGRAKLHLGIERNACRRDPRGAVCCTFVATRAAAPSAAVRWAVLAGILAGATALVRPIAILLGVPLAIALVVAIAAGAQRVDRRRGSSPPAPCWPRPRVLPAFWIARNDRETGVATLSSLAGINLLHLPRRGDAGHSRSRRHRRQSASAPRTARGDGVP